MIEQVLYEPFPKQEEFLKAALCGKYRFILYGGAIRGGKTFGGLGTLLVLCKLYAHSRWAIVRDSLPTLKRNTIVSFNKICPKSFIKSYNQDTQTVTFTNNSQIIFFAENYDDDKELNRWKGLEVNGFLLEEGNELQEVSFYKAIERAGSHIPPAGNKKPKPLVLLTCNPSQGWIKKTFYDRFRDGTLPPLFKYISAKITDNPAVTADKEYMEALKQMPEIQYRIFVDGDWDVNINELPWLYSFNRDKHVRKVPFLPSYPVHLSFDFNNDPFACIASQHSDQKGTPTSFKHYIKEFVGEMKVEAMCAKIREAFPNSIFFITGDRSGQNEDIGRNQTLYKMIAGLLRCSDRQIHTPSYNLTHADSRLLCNSMFNNYENFYISPDCPNLIADCEKATIDLKSSTASQLLKDRGAYKMDAFDAMRYDLQTYFNKFAKEKYFRVIKANA